MQPYSKKMQIGPRRKKESKNFNQKTIIAIFVRDDWRCVKCGSHKIMSVPHHITYKSQGGLGEKRNGATVCVRCHDFAHHKEDSVFGEPSKEGKQWFKDWRDRNLDQNGDFRRDWENGFR